MLSRPRYENKMFSITRKLVAQWMAWNKCHMASLFMVSCHIKVCLKTNECYRAECY